MLKLLYVFLSIELHGQGGCVEKDGDEDRVLTER